MTGTRVPSRCAAAVLTYDRVAMASSTVRYLLEIEGFAGDDVFVFVNGVGGVEPELERRVTVVNLDENRGPAGGMRAAMTLTAERGYAWVYLCEDDVGALLAGSGPRVRRLMDDVQGRSPLPAAVLAYGRTLDRRTGLTRPLVPTPPADGEETLVPCDVGAWGATLVNLTAVCPDLLPDERLWFGYEDFDFFLGATRAGYPILLDATTAAALGQRPHPSGRAVAYRGVRRVDDTDAWRRYYEARNFVTVCRRYGSSRWMLWHVGKSMRRASMGGLEHWVAVGRGLYDGVTDRMGPSPRYGRRLADVRNGPGA